MADEPAASRYVVIYGAQVDDEPTYTRYRAAMTPILHAHGGAFRYDFAVSRVLISETAPPINRVFMIGFSSRAAADALFADPRYLAVRRALFEPAVTAITQLAGYEEPLTPDARLAHTKE
jgi:uncharacterized protein (DUF1330 family)